MSPNDGLQALQLDPTFQGRRITADYVADSLRDAIQRGVLADGAVLNQAALAEHFSVSRVPVREAMRQLMAEGLIEAEAHHVAMVRGITLERLHEIYENRALLEGSLLERAVPKIPRAVLSELSREEKLMRSEKVHSRWLERNAVFHHTMNEFAGDATGLELVAQLRSRAQRYVYMWAGGDGVHQPEVAGLEHVEILECVLAGDGEGARKSVERHIRSTGSRLVSYGRSLDHGSRNAAD